MDFCYFIGIDISKDTLDWAVYTPQQGIILSIQTDNTRKGIKSALTQLKALPGWNSTQAVFCQEHTGIYNAHLLELLYELNLSIWLESSLQIKQAGGMQRGKTDKVDAQRIAQYAYGFRDQMRLWTPPREVIQKLAFLTGPPFRFTPLYDSKMIRVTLERVGKLRKVEGRANFVVAKRQSHDQTVGATDRPSMGSNFAFFQPETQT